MHIMGSKKKSHKHCIVGEEKSAEQNAADATDTPIDLDELMLQHVNTITYIPKAARTKFAICLSKIITDACNSQSEEPWQLLLIFAKCVLWRPPRGGKKHLDLGKCVLDRLKKWEEGRRRELWSTAVSEQSHNKHPANSTATTEDKARRAERLASLGRYSMACQALGSDGVAPESAETLEDSAALTLHHQNRPPLWKHPMNALLLKMTSL
jgi:hypothetical protein